MADDMLGKVVRLIVNVPATALGRIIDLLQKLAAKDGETWAVALGKFLRKENPWVESAPVDPDAWVDELDLTTIETRAFEFEIDPADTIEAQRDAGEYTDHNPNFTTAVFGSCRKITEGGKRKVKVVAFRIGRSATRQQAIRLRTRLNLGAICVQHLLALGAQHKRAQQELNWIVNPDDVGSVDGESCVSYLYGDGARRNLDCDDARSEWDGSTWFLGLSESAV